MLQNNVGLVTIENFDTRCAEETITAIETLLDNGAEKLILKKTAGNGVTVALAEEHWEVQFG